MRKIYIILLTTLTILSCSANDEIVNAPKSIENTSWNKHFNKSEVELASGGTSQGSVNSINITFKIFGQNKFELKSYTSTTTQGNVSNNFYGLYTYNPNNGKVVFTYNDINLFGNKSDEGIINGDILTLENTYIFKKQ